MTVTDLLALLVVAGEWTGLARGIAGAPYYAAVLDVALIGLTGYVGVRAVRAGRQWPLPLLAVLIGAYMILSAVQMLNPNVPSLLVGLEGYRKTAFTMLAFFVVMLADGGNSRRFFGIVAIGSTAAFLWAVRQSLLPLPFDLAIIETTTASPIGFHAGAVLRAFSPTAGPFHLGVLSASVMVISLVRAVHCSRWWLLLAVLAGATLGLTLTRANIAAGVVAVLAVVVFASPWRQRVRLSVSSVPALTATALAAFVAVGAIAVPVAGVPTPSTTASEQPAQPTPTSRPDVGDVVEGVATPLDDRSLQFRLTFWREYLSAIAQRPLIGYGTSAAADGFDHRYEGTSSVNFEPHSLYFKAALELGIGGLVLLLVILAIAFWRSVRTLRRDALLGLTAIGIIVVIGASGLTGPMLDAYPMNVLFWAMLGWLVRPAAVEGAPPGS